MVRNRIKIYVVPHSHIDMEWYWTVQDLEQMLPDLFYTSALRVLAKDPEMTFAQDQAMLVQMMLKNASEEQQKLVQNCIDTNRMELVGGMYVQPELQEPCGEALIRQIQIGQNWMQQNLGTKARCAWQIDSFGQINQLPQILLQSGYQNYVFMRDVNETDGPQSFPTEFVYEGPDGSRIVTHWLKNTYVLRESGKSEYLLQIAGVQLTKENESAELKKVFEALMDPKSVQHQTGAMLLLWGDDLYRQKFTTKEIRQLLIEAARRAEVAIEEEDIIFATPSQFFDAIREKTDVLDVKLCDFGLPKNLQDLRGTFIARIKLKQLNRKAEEALLSLESLFAVAGKKIEDSDELWKPVLFNQFHDTIAGSCLDEGYLAAIERYKKTLDIAHKRKQALFGENANTTTFCVFNPTQFTREDWVNLLIDKKYAKWSVVDESGIGVPTYYDEKLGMLKVLVSNIWPYGVKQYHLIPEQLDHKETISSSRIENEFYGLQIDEKTGDLTGIWDKIQEREILRMPANVIVAKQEQNPDMEGALRLTGMEYDDCGLVAKSVQKIKTDVETRVVCIKNFLGFELEKQIVLRNGCRRVEFYTNIRNYPGEDYILTAAFPMNMQAAESIFETPFAVAVGRTGLHCAQKWAALQEDTYRTALLNQGTCGYWVDENTLSVALLRGYKDYKQYGIDGCNRGIERFLDGKTHTELASERGDHNFAYALVSGAYNNAEISADAVMYNSSLEAYWNADSIKMNPLIKEIPKTFIMTKLGMTEQGDLCLRGYYLGQSKGKCVIQLARPVEAADKVDLTGNIIQRLTPEGSKIAFPVRPYEIITLLIK